MNRFRVKGKILGAVCLGMIFLYTGLGFFLAPVLVKKILPENLGKILHRTVTLESVAVNPYTLTLEIRDFAVKQKDSLQKNLFSFDRVFADLCLVSLFKGGPVLDELTLESPMAWLALNPDGRFSFSDLMETDDLQKTAREKGEASPFLFSLANVRIIGGGLEFFDRIRDVTHRVENLELDLPWLSNLETDRGTQTQMDVAFLLNRAGIKISVASRPFTKGRDTDIRLAVSSMDLRPFLPYIPVPDSLTVTTMNLGLNLHAAFTQSPARSLVLQGRAGLDHVHVQEKGGTPVFTLPEVSLVLSPSDLFKKEVFLERLTLQSPGLHIHRDREGRVNLLSHVNSFKRESTRANFPEPNEPAVPRNPSKEKPPAPQTLGPGFSFTLAQGQIQDARVDVFDDSGSSPFETRISPVHVQITNLTAGSGDPGISGKFSLSLETEAKETLSTAGSFAGLTVDGSVQLGGLELKKYAPYYQDVVGFDIQDGQLSLDTEFQVSGNEHRGLTLETRDLQVKALKIGDRINGDSPIEIPELRISGSRIDLTQKKVEIGKIETARGSLLVRRRETGSINLIDNLTGRGGPKKTQGRLGKEPSFGPGDPDSWKIFLSSLDLFDYSVAFQDLSRTDPVSIDLSGIQFHASTLGTAVTRNGQISLSADWNQRGRIQAKGDLVLFPLGAGLDVSLQDIDVHDLEPYFADQVKIMVTSGRINVKGRLGVDLKNKEGRRVSFQGDTFLTDFHSLDRHLANDLFQCDSLYVSGMDVSLFPVKVTIADISLTDFYSRFIISEKGEINIKKIFDSKGPEAPAAPAPKTKDQKSPEISIGDITLQGGHIEFSDYLTRPGFTANMKKIAGSLTGISSLDTGPASINLKGIHGTSSPLEITGSVSPLTEKKSADINVSFQDIELAKFTPYSSRYLGYTIEKGKLVLDLNYKIDGNRLDSRNRLVFDQLTLGEKTDSKEATSLPIALAINLLTNSDGRIDLDLPVKGNLDDPEFRFGSVVWKMISNLIVKAVTAPFSILGSLFGGGEKLGYVDFAHGQTMIDGENRQRLDQLTDILAKKPGLKLEILGMYDPVHDAHALTALQLEDLLKSMKVKKDASTARDVKSLREVVVLPQEREILVRSAYESASFPKPRESDGKEKPISVLEQEKLLITHMRATDSDLKLLAMTRAENVKAYILSLGKVPAARLFLLDPVPVDEQTREDRIVKVKFSFK